jgi:hypothetical protein
MEMGKKPTKKRYKEITSTISKRLVPLCQVMILFVLYLYFFGLFIIIIIIILIAFTSVHHKHIYLVCCLLVLTVSDGYDVVLILKGHNTATDIFDFAVCTGYFDENRVSLMDACKRMRQKRSTSSNVNHGLSVIAKALSGSPFDSMSLTIALGKSAL